MRCGWPVSGNDSVPDLATVPVTIGAELDAAAARLGVPPPGCVVIEDAVAGVEGARRAGMRCIAVTNTNPADELSAASLVVDSLEKVSSEREYECPPGRVAARAD